MKCSEENKQKFRQMFKGKKMPIGFGEKISKIMKGRKCSEETKEKLRQYKISEENLQKLRQRKITWNDKISKSLQTYAAKMKMANRPLVIPDKKETTKHHIDLEINSNRVMWLSQRDHLSIHHSAYEYLVKINQIDSYIDWFKNNKAKDLK